MSAEQLATRIIGEQTGIPANKIRRGELSDGDYEKIKQASTQLQDVPLCIDERSVDWPSGGTGATS
jgi:replicative DNA helicase